MQHVPESRQQTFEEIYGPPENFLEIEVRNPTTQVTLKPKQDMYPVSRAISTTPRNVNTAQSSPNSFPFQCQRHNLETESQFTNITTPHIYRSAIPKPMAHRGTCTPRTRSSAGPTSLRSS